MKGYEPVAVFHHRRKRRLKSPLQFRNEEQNEGSRTRCGFAPRRKRKGKGPLRFRSGKEKKGLRERCGYAPRREKMVVDRG